MCKLYTQYYITNKTYTSTSIFIVFSNRTNLDQSANLPAFSVVPLKIEANATSVSITFDIFDDQVALEEDEDYELRLELVTTDPRVSVASPDESTLVILDDDGELTFLW